MPPSVRVRLTNKAKEGPCDHCKDAVRKDELHATLVMTFGRSQTGRTKYRGLHLHVACLPKWLIGDHMKYALREKKPPGRPTGSILKLSAEDNRRRKWLVRTRARLIREVTRSADGEHIWNLYNRALEIAQELKGLGGDVNVNLARRSPESRKAFMDKVKLKVRPRKEG